MFCQYVPVPHSLMLARGTDGQLLLLCTVRENSAAGTAPGNGGGGVEDCALPPPQLTVARLMSRTVMNASARGSTGVGFPFDFGSSPSHTQHRNWCRP